MNFFDYAFHHMGCTWRIIRGDDRALDDMDISADGFWRSFEALIAAFPALLFAWVVVARQIQAGGIPDSTFSIVARLATLEIALWILPVIVFAVVLPALGFGRRFSHLVIARNWLGAMIAYLFVIVPISELVGGGGETNQIALGLTLIVIVAAFWTALRLTVVALATTGGAGFLFVLTEWIARFFIEIQMLTLMGLLPQA